MIGLQIVPPTAPTLRATPNDTVLFAVLGATRIGHATVAEIAEAAKLLAPGDWQPTGDVIIACVRDAIATGLIRAEVETVEAGPGRLEVTEAGTERLIEMLHASAPVAGGLGRVCAAMRLCFLVALAPDARDRCVAALRRDHELELADLRRRCSGCPYRSRFARTWMDHEIGRIEWELSWLERFPSAAVGNSATG